MGDQTKLSETMNSAAEPTKTNESFGGRITRWVKEFKEKREERRYDKKYGHGSKHGLDHL